MVRAKRYLWQHPSGRWYVRKDGRYQPLKDDDGIFHAPDTEAGDRLYWQIINGKRYTSKRDLRWLIAEFRGSPKYADLAPRTRQDYDRVLDYMDEKAGDRDPRLFRRSDIIAAQHANAHRVRFANYIPQVMSILFQYAEDRDVIRAGGNPSVKIDRLKVPAERRQEHVPWTEAAVKRMRKGATDWGRLVFELGTNSVQRPADLLRFTWEDLDGDELVLTQGKTGKRLPLPCLDPLMEELDRTRAARTKAGIPLTGPIILGRRGRPTVYRSMAQEFRRERERTGTLAHDMHAMRYYGVQELARAGCTVDEIKSFSGHLTKAMVEKYAGAVWQETLARQAAGKRR